MGKALIIAEKPSVAGDISRALGGFKKHADYYENDEFVVSSAVGHLLELIEPEKFQVKRGKWTFKHLPVIPDRFDLKPIEKSAPRLKLLTRLCKRKDVDSIINACDAGREGELIFRYIVQHTKSKKPIKRLWLRSMTQNAIREGFINLREDSTMLPLADAAMCRSEADWLVGINGTRAMTAFNSKTGGFHLTTVGRVQTPTLSIVVEREELIKKFVPRDYWEVHGTFKAEVGEYAGRWFNEDFSKANREKDQHARAERIWERKDADAIRDKCIGKPGTVTEESKPSKQAPPLLYDLTSLQREANSRFGLSATQTLQIAQALYERHKMLTYPRTDSRALPEDYPDTVKKTLGVMQDGQYANFADDILKNGWVKPNKRVFNDAKISDHFAIIPTTQKPKKLKEIEQKLYDMVVRRFLAVFYPSAEFEVTTRITRVEGESFRTDGKVLVKPGWQAVYGKGGNGDSENLTPVKQGETVNAKEVVVQDNVTKPPARFTEATLLSAMEGAGKLVSDDELRTAMAEKGLGTPATRASIIENLLREKYLVRDQKELIPMAKAFGLMALLRGLGVETLTKPELTGDWEFKLNQIQRGELSRPEFMAQIAGITDHMVQKAKEFEDDTIPGDFGKLKVPCPKCGSVIKETYKKFQCSSSSCDFSLWKIVAGRQFESEEIEELITKKVIGPLQGFRSKMGRPFNAAIKFTSECKAEFDFGDDDKKDEPVDFTGQEPLGKCPICQGNVFTNTNNYVCENSVGDAKKKCSFRSGKIILQQVIEPEQMKKLLTDGKTDLFEKFISKRNGRPFKAHLVLDDKGKVGFEFEKRDPKAAKKKYSREPAKPVDLSGLETIGTCPRCKSKVYISEDQYLCERTQAEKRKCKFKSGREICQRKITKEEMTALLTEGRTPVLENFISKAGKPFSAALVMDDQGKSVFEFPDSEE
ncbi:MAG: DNA topoisomerase III [Verrucomicrobiales bacterium]|nr:DNA topoisomerase III [Verrucomicrobiales bacterium]|tara:strand:+ start:13798 stop:16593 length:2796 start_codon:yes stop_codon:yes gene_type:complete